MKMGLDSSSGGFSQVNKQNLTEHDADNHMKYTVCLIYIFRVNDVASWEPLGDLTLLPHIKPLVLTAK